mmetsp:Transcript_17285/g.40743  ORF Transcript_17285/g.40743 Transcript_17285/m.40743 type:complete len:290 (+) Transcript_17285:334-1203(+)
MEHGHDADRGCNKLPLSFLLEAQHVHSTLTGALDNSPSDGLDLEVAVHTAASLKQLSRHPPLALDAQDLLRAASQEEEHRALGALLLRCRGGPDLVLGQHNPSLHELRKEAEKLVVKSVEERQRNNHLLLFPLPFQQGDESLTLLSLLGAAWDFKVLYCCHEGSSVQDDDVAKGQANEAVPPLCCDVHQHFLADHLPRLDALHLHSVDLKRHTAPADEDEPLKPPLPLDYDLLPFAEEMPGRTAQHVRLRRIVALQGCPERLEEVVTLAFVAQGFQQGFQGHLLRRELR